MSGSSPSDIVRQSKLLSLVLRHEPQKVGLTLGEGGWVPVADLLEGLARIGRPMTPDQLRTVVADNDKKRFTLSEDGLRIRAAQGHSQPIEFDLQPQPPPDCLYHGTATRFLDAILAEGLKPMSRLHVHLSLDVATAVTVGRRHGKPVVLAIDSVAMAKAGEAFYVADNGVWLTARVAPQFLTVLPEGEN